MLVLQLLILSQILLSVLSRTVPVNPVESPFLNPVVDGTNQFVDPIIVAIISIVDTVADSIDTAFVDLS